VRSICRAGDVIDGRAGCVHDRRGLLGIVVGISDHAAAGICDSGRGAIDIVSVRGGLANPTDGALFGNDVAERVVAPAGLTGAIAYSCAPVSTV